VQGVGVEKDRVARLHFAVNFFEPLFRFGDPLAIGPGLVAGENVVDAAHLVRALEHLEASVFACRRIDRDHHAAEIRKEDAILIPIAVVLMPGPGPTGAGVLQDHLGVVMIDLATDELLDRVNDTAAAGHHAVDPLARMIPEGKAHLVALAIVARHCGMVESMVGAGGRAESCDFVR
jgi:hypothetical protein